MTGFYHSDNYKWEGKGLMTLGRTQVLVRQLSDDFYDG